jgi:hypothetical protein
LLPLRVAAILPRGEDGKTIIKFRAHTPTLILRREASEKGKEGLIDMR